MIVVSIIVPAYNAERTIEKSLKSLINQTYKNIEIIVVNDASTDNTENIIDNLIIKDKRIVKYNIKSSGVVKARKKGIEKSNGDYIMFLDADDLLDINAIKELVEITEKNSTDIIKFSSVTIPIKSFNYVVSEEKVLMNEKIKEMYKQLICNDKYSAIWDEFIRKDIIDIGCDALNCDLQYGEDLILNMNLYEKSEKIILLPNVYYYYYYNSSSVTKRLDFFKIKKIINDIIKSNKYVNNYIKIYELNPKVYEKKILKKIFSQMEKMTVCKNCNYKVFTDYIKELNKNVLYMDIYNENKRQLYLENKDIIDLLEYQKKEKYLMIKNKQIKIYIKTKIKIYYDSLINNF